MLTLGWSDGSTFFPVNSILLSTDNKKNRINEATTVDKRTVGYKRRRLVLEKGTQAMLELLKQAKNAAIPAKYVLFDSWFSSPSSLHAEKEIGYDVIAMVKKTLKMFFRYDGKDMSLISIYNKNKKRRGRSKYLLSVMVDVLKDGEIIPAMPAHTAVVFTRYMMLSLENRESNEERSLGELFLYFSDEMSDIPWIQAFEWMLPMFRTLFADQIDIADEKIDELVDTFMDAIPALLRSKLQVA